MVLFSCFADKLSAFVLFYQITQKVI